MAKTYRVIFQPFGRQISVAEGCTLLDAAREAGIEMNAPCGGKGTCGGCRVEVTRGTQPPSAADHRELSAEELGRNLRLACQTRVAGDMTVAIPRETLLFDQHILEAGVEVQVALDPSVHRVHLDLPAPALDDQRSDADRVIDALGELGIDAGIDLSVARRLTDRLHRYKFSGTAVVVGDRIARFERGDSSAANYGVAVDVGTTTVVASLMDLGTGAQVAVASCANPQASRGDDVVSRVEYCQGSAERLRELSRMIVESLDLLIGELCTRADIKPTHIYDVAVVGNTTMMHLLLRLSVDHIARSPFIAAVRGGVLAEPRDVGLRINKLGRVYVGPSVAGFVGADTVGVILATGADLDDRMRLVIDIGTNGELVLGNRERLLCCSTAAGPAFEGARIRYGMRASAGAIDRVDLDDGRVKVHTIRDEPAVGLCGTGLIEAVAALLRAGVIDLSGRLLAGDDLPDVPATIAERVVVDDGEPAFVLATAEESGSDHPVMLTQKDIREVQLAKGALYAGTQTLLAEMGLRAADLDEVLLAGAFGNFIRPERVRDVGLLPDVPTGKMRFVGNAAGTGAKMLLLDRKLRARAEEISLGVEHVELGGRADFQMHFAEAMLFPTPAEAS